MIRWTRAVLGALLGVVSISALAQTCPTTGASCTATISPGANVTAAIQARTAGQTLCLNTGTYTPQAAGAWGDTNAFGMSNAITVCGLGATPSQTILQGGGASDYAVKFTNYSGFLAANTTLTNVQVNNSATGGANGGIAVFNFGTPAGRMNGVTLRDLVIQTKTAGGAFGILLQDSDKINISNVTVTSNQTAFYLFNSTQALIANSTVTGVANGVANGANALSVIGGNSHVIVGNTFGSPKVGGTYSLPQGAVTFYNTSSNRFDGNVVQGFHDDGVDFTAADNTGVTTALALDNYAGKNSVIATGGPDGLGAGSAIWANCGSNNTWIYGNDASGAPECGICTWMAKSNMLLGNVLHNNYISGVVISGGAEAAPFCSAQGGAFQFKPTSTFIVSNYAYFNRNDQFFVRNSDNTTIASNVASVFNGLGGPNVGCNPFCPGAFVFDFNNGGTNQGARIVGNTNHEGVRGIISDDGVTTGLEVAYNRSIQSDPSSLNRYILPGSVTSTNWDGGPLTGGNYWTFFTNPNGNPGNNGYGTNGSANAHLGVFDSGSNTTGKIVDRFPFAGEDLGRGYNVTVYEPLANTSLARGTRKTVRWYAPGCVYVDITLVNGGALLASNQANTGYAVVTIPAGASIAAGHTIQVTCKDSGGTARATGTSPSFTINDSQLKLLAPGRDDVFNANTEIIVAWTKASGVGNVTIELSVNGGATYTTNLGTFAGLSARVTLPSIPSTAYAVLRVTAGANRDQTDGVFAIRGASGAGFTNVTAGRNLRMGSLERLEWASPQNSRLVDITATVGGVLKTVAPALPDRGYYDWILPEWAASGTLTLSATFKQNNGSTISTVPNNSGNAVAPALPGVINPPRLANLSTRGKVLTGSDVMIGGFAVSGAVPKTVVIRAVGPSLTNYGVQGALTDPQIQLVRSSDNATIATNDDWPATANLSALLATGLQPVHAKEAALYMTLSPGLYTAIVSGVGGATGVGLVEVYEIDRPDVNLINISTRGKVLTGSDVMIGGFVVTGSAAQQVLIRAIGPSLTQFGVAGALPDPTMQLVRISDSAVLATNDNWQSSNAAAITASGHAPSNPLESAILITLQPGAYTAVVSGVNGATGVGLVEVYTVP